MLPHRWRRAIDLAQATYLERTRFDPVLPWTPEQLAAHQEQAWRAAARAAVARAPYYRELYRGLDLDRAPLRELPPVGKVQLMDRFDEAVTDPALRLADLEAFLRTASADDTFRGRFRVLTTSGSTGRRGIVVYDRREWLAVLAAALRNNRALMDGRLRQRLATFTSTHPAHISARLLRASDVGLAPRLAVAPGEPLEEALPRLERFRPEVLFGYPSAIAPVARAQLDGHARLRPERVIAGGEAVTPAFREAVRAAWGCEVLDLYATTETGALAVESPGGRGTYLLEDTTLVEVVDARERPVPDGECGDHRVSRTHQQRRRCGAVREMREGPSASAIRSWRQTAASCGRQERPW